jgi:NADPH:quinone reductase-like Zn-dependent oxidoreductase
MLKLLDKVMVASLNAADFRSLAKGRTPKSAIIGSDSAGIVVSPGRGAFKPGHAVAEDLSVWGFGAMAEVTAQQALRRAELPIEEASLVVLGAGGGVETYDIVIAVHDDQSSGTLRWLLSAAAAGPILSLGARKLRVLCAKPNAAERRLRPVIARVYPVSEACAAFEIAESGRAWGKLVVEFGEGERSKRH